MTKKKRASAQKSKAHNANGHHEEMVPYVSSVGLEDSGAGASEASLPAQDAAPAAPPPIANGQQAEVAPYYGPVEDTLEGGDGVEPAADPAVDAAVEPLN